jgi:hypothetical protein
MAREASMNSRDRIAGQGERVWIVSRMQNDDDMVEKYLGVSTLFDIGALYTNSFLDPSIKMVDVPEMKFQPKLPGSFQ